MDIGKNLTDDKYNNNHRISNGENRPRLFLKYELFSVKLKL
jgi:hypothetical protein